MDQHPPQLWQLRSDLEFSPQQHQGKSVVVVKDPITARYFRFTDSQAAILELLHEPIEASTLAKNASQKLNASIPITTIDAFLNSLEDKWLLDTAAVGDKLATVNSHKIQDRNLLYWKLLSINPDKIFQWLLPRTNWAFTKAFHVFAALSIASGFIISFLHWDEFRGGVQGLFNLHGLFFLWIVIFTVVTIHEFSHGLTCCHFGGKVKEVGFMLIYFQPAFYCDVSDSWMFPSRRNRMWVTFAGGYVQLVIWGVCTMIWRVTDPDTLINQIVLIVIVFAGLQTVVNFNPLIKLDGYYMLSDWIETPNLRAKAMNSLWSWIGRKHRSAHPWREERAQLVYGVASIAFSTTLLIYVYTALYTWATTRFAFAGLVGFTMFSTITLRRTAGEYFTGLRAVASRAAVRKYRNAGIALAALVVVFVGHMGLRIPAEFRILAKSDMAVRSETGGVVVEMLVREGSHVAKGEVLARLRDFDKQQRLSELSGNFESKRHELELLMAGARPEEIETKDRQVATKRMELENARRNQEQRNQLTQTLELKKSQLTLDKQTLARTRELVTGGLSPRVELDKAETAVTVREKDVAETEAALRFLTET